MKRIFCVITCLALMAACVFATAAETDLTTPQPVVRGDVDRDGKLTTTDARWILQVSAIKMQPFPGTKEYENYRAFHEYHDLDGDGWTNTTDARLILQYCAGKIDRFPIEDIQTDANA